MSFSREKIKKLLPVLQAYAEGKEIEVTHDCREADKWRPLCCPAEFNEPPEHYRIAPKPEYVDLEPGDVPPGSVLRHTETLDMWQIVTHITHEHVCLALGRVSYNLACRQYEILRPGAESWEPCHKPKP